MTKDSFKVTNQSVQFLENNEYLNGLPIEPNCFDENQSVVLIKTDCKWEYMINDIFTPDGALPTIRQEIVDMITGGTQTNISITYNSENQTFDFVVIEGGGSFTCNDVATCINTNINTQVALDNWILNNSSFSTLESNVSFLESLVTQEQVQDWVAPLFTSGGQTGISFVYNDALNRIEATVTASGGFAIEDEGVALPTQPIMNFIGGGVTVTTIAGKYVVNIPGGGAGFSCSDVANCITSNPATQTALENFIEASNFTVTGNWTFSNSINTNGIVNTGNISTTTLGVTGLSTLNNVDINGITSVDGPITFSNAVTYSPTSTTTFQTGSTLNLAGNTVYQTGNTTTGIQNFGATYTGNYVDNSTLNMNGDINYGATNIQTYTAGSIVTGETTHNNLTTNYTGNNVFNLDDGATITNNLDGDISNNYDANYVENNDYTAGAEINNTGDVIINNTDLITTIVNDNVVNNISGDVSNNYDANYVENNTYNPLSVVNNTGGIINNSNQTINNTGVTQTFDNTSTVTYNNNPTFNNGVTINGPIVVTPGAIIPTVLNTLILNTATTTAVANQYIVVTYTGGNTTINLPDATLIDGQQIKIKKFTGEDVRVTTIVPFGGQLIDGFTGATMNINRTMYTYTAINGNWYLGD